MSITTKIPLWQSLTNSMLPDLNNFMQKRLNVKSKDCRSALPQKSNQGHINKTAVHLAFINLLTYLMNTG